MMYVERIYFQVPIIVQQVFSADRSDPAPFGGGNRTRLKEDLDYDRSKTSMLSANKANYRFPWDFQDKIFHLLAAT